MTSAPTHGRISDFWMPALKRQTIDRSRLSETHLVQRTRWLAIVTSVLALLWSTAIVLAEPEHRAGTLLAGVNIALAALIAWVAWRARRVEAIPLIAFLPGIVACWSMSCIYFAAFLPDAGYQNMFRETLYLESMLEMQVTTLVFLLGYGTGVVALLRLRRGTRAVDVFAGRRSDSLEWYLTLAGLFAITVGWMAAFGLGGRVVWFVANGLRNYLVALVLIAGYRWEEWNWRRRGTVLAALSVATAVHTLMNGRAPALWPWIMVALGYLISPSVTRRRKTLLILGFLFALPPYVVFGNQTRASQRGLGLTEIDARAQVLGAALQSGTMMYQHSGPVSDLMGRLFSSGGHALIKENWEHTERLRFDLVDYAGELLRSLIPGYLLSETKESKYSSTTLLREYGFAITDTTSVELSLIGSLFTYVGLVSVLLGGLLLGVYHAFFCRLFSDRRMNASWRLACFAGAASVNGWAYNIDFIGNVRSLVWVVIYISMVYGVLAVAIGIFGRVGGKQLAGASAT